MKTAVLPSKGRVVRELILDIFALAVIYFVPAIAHLTGIPIYMAEPMRLIIILLLPFLSRLSTYALALSLPAFSFLVSGHPEPVKMLIITGELILNVYLFFMLSAHWRNKFTAMLVSILASKVACYAAYWIVFSTAFVVAEAQPGFLAIQLLTTLVFSIYSVIKFQKDS